MRLLALAPPSIQAKCGEEGYQRHSCGVQAGIPICIPGEFAKSPLVADARPKGNDRPAQAQIADSSGGLQTKAAAPKGGSVDDSG